MGPIKTLIFSLSISFLITAPCYAEQVTVSLDKDCNLDKRLWQVGTSYQNVRINSDKKTFTVNFPAGTKICAYINQDTYCSCWGYKYCEGPQPQICPTGGSNDHLLVLIIGGCATIPKNIKNMVIPVNCGNF